MSKDTPDKYEVLPLKLWSPLHSHLAASQQLKSSPQQWLGIIRNLEKKGVSRTEIAWSVIISYLESSPARYVQLSELLAFVSSAPPCELVLQRHINDEFSPDVRFVKQERPAEFPPETIRCGRREVRLLHYKDRSFGFCIWLHVDVEPGLFGRHRYWSFSVPSGWKHLPSFQNDKEFYNVSEAMAYGRVLIKSMARRLEAQGFVGSAKNLNHYDRFALPHGEHYTEWLITAPNLPEGYWGEHFRIKNLIAHVRTTLRTTPQGDRVLLLEEIQSDWNQELRAAILNRKLRQLPDDYIDDYIDMIEMPPMNPYLNHWLDAALRMMLLLAVQQGYAGIAWLPGRLHAERFPEADAKGLEAFYDQIVPKAVRNIAKVWSVTLGEMRFSTLSRCFDVTMVSRPDRWRVFCVDSGRVAGDNFPDFEKAEEFRRSIETQVLEVAPCLMISPDMRADIQDDGLPCLGAIERQMRLISSHAIA